MRIHIELGGLSGSECRADALALGQRLCATLSARGHAVTTRGLHPILGARALRSEEVVGRVDPVVCVETDAPTDVLADRHVAWSHTTTWPRKNTWDAVVVHSSSHASALLPELTQAIIAPGCGDVIAATSPPDRLLYAGRPSRGLHHLLAAWPEIWRAFRAPLAIVDDLRTALRFPSPPAAARLQGIRALLDQPGIIVHPALSPIDRQQAFGRAIALLHPLDPIPPDADVSALAVHEAAEMGCPAILTPTDGLAERFDGHATFVGAGPFDAGSWIRAIQAVLQDRERRADAAKAFAAAHPWRAWEDAWEIVLTSPHRAARTALPAPQRWVIAVGGGAEDARFVVEVARHARRRGHTVDALAAPTAGSNDSADWARAVLDTAGAADRLVLCSSRVCAPVLESLRTHPAPAVYTLDSRFPLWLTDAPDSKSSRR